MEKLRELTDKGTRSDIDGGMCVLSLVYIYFIYLFRLLLLFFLRATTYQPSFFFLSLHPFLLMLSHKLRDLLGNTHSISFG